MKIMKSPIDMNIVELTLTIENMGLWASAITAPLPPGDFIKRAPVALEQWFERYDDWYKYTQKVLKDNREMRKNG